MKISYYKFRAESEGGFRTYLLLAGKQQERLIHVNSLIRLKGLLFSQGPGGPAARVPRSFAAAAAAGQQLKYLSRDVNNSILACCYE